MAIRWDNIRPHPKGVYFDLAVLMSAIHQIPVIREKNDQAELHRYQMENEFKTTPDNDQ